MLTAHKKQQLLVFVFLFSLLNNLFPALMEHGFSVDQRKVAWDTVKKKLQNPPLWWYEIVHQNIEKFLSKPLTTLLPENCDLNAIPRIKTATEWDDRFYRIIISDKKISIISLNARPFSYIDNWVAFYESILKMLIDHNILTENVDFVLYASDLVYTEKLNIPIFSAFKNKVAENSSGILLIPHFQILQMFFKYEDRFLKALQDPVNAWEHKKSILLWRGATSDVYKRGIGVLSPPGRENEMFGRARFVTLTKFNKNRSYAEDERKS